MFAEHYDPEEDEGETEQIFYPKSDAQRRCLSEAIKNILLFRSLEPVGFSDNFVSISINHLIVFASLFSSLQSEMSELIDAMFERKVLRDREFLEIQF